MVTEVFPDFQAERCDFGFAHIHSGRFCAAGGFNMIVFKHADHGIFHLPDQFAHTEFQAADVQQQIRNDLPGTVISDLTATIGFNHRDSMIVQQMLRFSGNALGKNRRVLQQPNFIMGLLAAVLREILHRLPGRLVIA